MLTVAAQDRTLILLDQIRRQPSPEKTFPAVFTVRRVFSLHPPSNCPQPFRRTHDSSQLREDELQLIDSMFGAINASRQEYLVEQTIRTWAEVKLFVKQHGETDAVRCYAALKLYSERDIANFEVHPLINTHL